MLADIWTITWKEWKEYLLAGGNVRSGLFRLLLFPAIWGIFVPLQAGRAWVTQPEMLFGYAWVPAFMVIGLVGDSFAGERERHTLETLLASRMPDRSILLGKIAATVAYAWGISLLALGLGLVTVNVAHAHGRVLVYPAAVALAVVGFSLLEAVLVASAGVLVSLRAPTVRHAQQNLTLGFIGAVLLVYAPFFVARWLPAPWQARLGQALATASPTEIALVVLVVLVALTLGLLAAAMARFQRARLILD